MQFEERKKDHHLVLRRFFSLFSRLSNFTLFSNINQTNYQLAAEPNQKAKRKSLKGVYIHNSFSPSPKNAPTNPSLPPSLIKNRKSHLPFRPQKKKRKRKFTTSTAPADSSSHPPVVHTPDTPANSSIRASRPMR